VDLRPFDRTRPPTTAVAQDEDRERDGDGEQNESGPERNEPVEILDPFRVRRVGIDWGQAGGGEEMGGEHCCGIL
jgi:hypothetical protein